MPPILASPPPPVRPEPVRPETSAWKRAFATAVRDPAELCRLLELPAEWATRATRAAEAFPLLAPRGYVARMRKGDPADPLLRQVMPLEAELDPTPGFVADPVGDAAAELSPGLLHKYRGRVLLVTTGACAVHCRYCFRRHFPYASAPKGVAAWRGALDQIAADPSIREVILSGGDPLTLVDETLAELATSIAAVPHVRRLRLHTRLPILIPERVTDALIAWLTAGRLTPVVVLHANHAQELDAEVAAAVAKLSAAGVVLLNQAVLLRGANDSADALADLSERLAELRVTPYYLHQLDRVAGAAHFEVPLDRGRRIVAELQSRLPGYLVPRYVQEVAGAPGKTPISPTGDAEECS
ncbi:MAG: EF-P beta-lysylation protein EpmB [Planctomycetota bacterium]